MVHHSSVRAYRIAFLRLDTDGGQFPAISSRSLLELYRRRTLVEHNKFLVALLEDAILQCPTNRK